MQLERCNFETWETCITICSGLSRHRPCAMKSVVSFVLFQLCSPRPRVLCYSSKWSLADRTCPVEWLLDIICLTPWRSWPALCCRSSTYLAMSLPSLFGALPRCGSSHRSATAAVTQMGAANGWLHGKSNRSWEGRVPSLEVDSCSVRRRSGFQFLWGARRVPAVLVCQTPRRQ